VAGHELIDDYLDDVAGRLRWRPDVDAITDELRDHLYSAVERRVAMGSQAGAAEHETLAAFGPPGHVAMDFVSTGTSGLAVPTEFSVTAGRLALFAAVGWALSSGLMIASELVDRATGQWEGRPQVLYLVGSSLMLISAALTAVVVVALVERHGGLGILGRLGIGLAALGAVATFVSWFYPGWVSLIGLGALLMAVALHRRSLTPRTPAVLFGSAWLVAAAVTLVLELIGVGTPDEWGDNRTALLAGLVVGCVGYAAALVGLGRWLAGEDAITQEEIRALALTQPVDHPI